MDPLRARTILRIYDNSCRFNERFELKTSKKDIQIDGRVRKNKNSYIMQVSSSKIC